MIVQADSIGCASWLLSSNVANTRFYESWGYVTVKEIMIGENNATWKKPPFPVLIVCLSAFVLLSLGLPVRCCCYIDGAQGAWTNPDQMISALSNTNDSQVCIGHVSYMFVNSPGQITEQPDDA